MAKDKGTETKKIKLPTAEKRDIQNRKKRMINQVRRSRIRTTIRQFKENLKTENQAVIIASLNQVYSALDKGVKKGIIKSNKAGRAKSCLSISAKAKIVQATQ